MGLFAGMFGGIALVLIAYFSPPRIYRTVLVFQYAIHFGLLYLAGREIEDPALTLTYLVGIGVVVEMIGLSSRRHRLLLQQHAQAEARARASESLLRGILATSPNQIVLKDREKRIQFVNSAFLASTGWQEELVLGKRDAELLPPEVADRYESLDDYVIREKKAHPDALDWVESSGGKVHWYKLTKTPIFDADGNVDQILSISSDVTELKTAQDTLNRHVQSLQILSEVSSLLLAAQGFDAGLEVAFPAIGKTLDATQLCLFVNAQDLTGDGASIGGNAQVAADAIDGAARTTDTSPAVLRHHWAAEAEVLNPARADMLRTAYDHVLRTRYADLLAGTVIALSGSEPEAQWHSDAETTGTHWAYIAPIFVADQLWGALLCVFQREEAAAAYLDSFFTALATNIGIAIDRHEALRANLREQNLLRSLVDNAPDFVYIKDTRHRYIIANRAFVEVMGFETEAEILGKSDYDIHPRAVADTVFQMDRPVLRGERTAYTVQEKVVLPLTNEHRWLLTTKAPFHNAEGEIVGLITISRDVTELKAVEYRLREAKEIAEAATRAKSEFLANMSHEIRTPLNGVIGMTSLLLSSTLQPDQREFVETIRTSSDDLLMILNDILDYSKIESGKLELEKDAFDPLTAVEYVVDLYSARRYGSPLTLSIVMKGALPRFLLGDVTRFRQVVGNLVANAVKFTQEGEVVVQLSATVDNGEQCILHVSVRDTGIGIPPTRVNKLFQSFTQVDSSTTRRFGGTGLGLAISKRLVEMMDGAIYVNSREGEGSDFHFTVRLPVVDVAESVALDQSIAGATGHRLPLRPSSTTYAERCFLLVDANPYSRSTIATQLQEWGGDVLAVDGREPMLAALHDNLAIDLVICDVDWHESALSVLAERTLAGQRGDALNMNGQDAPVLRGPVILQLAKWGVDTANTHIRTPVHADREHNGGEVLLRPVKPSALAEALARLLQPATDAQSVSGAKEPTYATPEKSQPPLLSAELPARILLVEDNLVNQRVALRMLDRLGYRADLAANGAEALAALATADYDVVFMDIHMPEMDGKTATRKIHAEFPPERRPYIIAMTADAMPGYREECLAAGMDDYIAKPVRLEDLAAALRRLIDRSTASEV